MICLAIGLGVLGFVAMRRAHRRCHYYGGSGYGWHGHHGHHGHGGPGRWMLYRVFQRIDASPAQERAIIGEVDKLRAKVRDTRHNLRDTRTDLAAALRGPVLDDAALGAVLGRVDGATGEVRGAVLDALRSIHGVLDDRQRQELAEMLEGGWRGGWRGSPYRM
jgi:Spy/CpxP family protein refolding chaperone